MSNMTLQLKAVKKFKARAQEEYDSERRNVFAEIVSSSAQPTVKEQTERLIDMYLGEPSSVLEAGAVQLLDVVGDTALAATSRAIAGKIVASMQAARRSVLGDERPEEHVKHSAATVLAGLIDEQPIEKIEQNLKQAAEKLVSVESLVDPTKQPGPRIARPDRIPEITFGKISGSTLKSFEALSAQRRRLEPSIEHTTRFRPNFDLGSSDGADKAPSAQKNPSWVEELAAADRASKALRAAYDAFALLESAILGITWYEVGTSLERDSQELQSIKDQYIRKKPRFDIARDNVAALSDRGGYLAEVLKPQLEAARALDRKINDTQEKARIEDIKRESSGESGAKAR